MGGCRARSWPGAVVSRRTRSLGRRRSIEAGLRDRDGAGNCQLLDFRAHNWSRAVVEADKELERKARKQGRQDERKKNGRAREAQTEGPAEPERDYRSDFQARAPNRWL